MPGTPGNIVEVVGTGFFGSTFVRDAAGALYVCGDNDTGQLGTGNTTDQSSFTAVTMPGGVTATKIDFGSNYVSGGSFYFLGSDGELYASGRNTVGELGTGTSTQATSFAKMIRAKSTSTETITSFRACGNGFDNQPTYGAVFALTSEGQLLACGRLASTGIGFGEDVGEFALMPISVD
jgi:alpha-tubulin suppressor-like RCC1 family protein